MTRRLAPHAALSVRVEPQIEVIARGVILGGSDQELEVRLTVTPV